MAYPISGGAILQVTRYCTINDQAVETVRCYQLPIGNDISDGNAFLIALANAIDMTGAGWGGLMTDNQSEDVINISYKAQAIYPQRYAYASLITAHTTGGAGGDAMPQNLAFVITCQGDYPGRHNVGNVHLTGFQDSQTSEGFIVPGFLGIMSNIAVALTNTLFVQSGNDSAQVYPVILNRAAPSTSQPITHATVQETVRTMRSRTVGRGI